MSFDVGGLFRTSHRDILVPLGGHLHPQVFQELGSWQSYPGVTRQKKPP
jgi:hypothetical protein